MKNLFFVFCIAAAALLGMSFTNHYSAPSDGQPDDIVGIWKNGEGTGMIEIYKKEDKFFGKVVWLKVPNKADGTPRTDDKNPDEKLRSQPLMGIENLRNFVWLSDGVWQKGTIYDPKKGKTYSCNITMTDGNTLEVRGYIGISLIGRTDTWKRQAAK